jgi:hypothetical protein
VPLIDTTREALNWMVAHEEATRGSRLVAYGVIAQAIGRSESWVRKFTSGDPHVSEPGVTLFEAIRHTYVKMCERVEREHADELRRIELMRGELNAADKGFREVVHRTPRTLGL